MLRVKSVKSDKEIAEIESLLVNTLSVEVNENGSISRVILRFPNKPAVYVTANFSDLLITMERSVTKYSVAWTRSIDGQDTQLYQEFDSKDELNNFISEKLSDLGEHELTLDSFEVYGE